MVRKRKLEAEIDTLTIVIEAVMETVGHQLKSGEEVKRGTGVIGTCHGDIHSLGKNLVASMLEASGFEVVNLGEDVPTEKFATAATEHRADIVAILALMTTSLAAMREVVDTIRKRRLLVKTMVGGGPATPDYAHAIGADGYGQDSVEAVHVAR